MPDLILLRHGESQWKVERRFTGQADVPLSSRGEVEARVAGGKLRRRAIDKLYTSALIRAVETARLALAAAGIGPLPTECSASLNERSYGELQGLSRVDARRRFGVQPLASWRQTYAGRPPGGESLEDTAARVLPYYERHVLVDLRAGRNVLLVAHGDCVRILVMHLDRLTLAAMLELKIPTAAPLLYEMTPEGTVKRRRYL